MINKKLKHLNAINCMAEKLASSGSNGRGKKHTAETLSESVTDKFLSLNLIQSDNISSTGSHLGPLRPAEVDEPPTKRHTFLLSLTSVITNGPLALNAARILDGHDT